MIPSPPAARLLWALTAVVETMLAASIIRGHQLAGSYLLVYALIHANMVRRSWAGHHAVAVERPE